MSPSVHFLCERRTSNSDGVALLLYPAQISCIDKESSWQAVASHVKYLSQLLSSMVSPRTASHVVRYRESDSTSVNAISNGSCSSYREHLRAASKDDVISQINVGTWLFIRDSAVACCLSNSAPCLTKLRSVDEMVSTNPRRSPAIGRWIQSWRVNSQFHSARKPSPYLRPLLTRSIILELLASSSERLAKMPSLGPCQPP